MKKMKNFVLNAKKWLQNWRQRRIESIEDARMQKVHQEAREVVQVMEFDGKLYACMHGVPLFESDDLKESLPSAVENARTAYVTWKMQRMFPNVLVL